MAEIGIVASIIQIADVGLRLSLKLYTFGETVASADRTVLSISKDISLTSSVLQELGHNLKIDHEARICSENAVKTAEEVVQECLKVFKEIDGLLEKSATRSGDEGKPKAKWTSAVVGKLKWPFLQPKMQLLRSNLDRLKATLLLMLNVMTYARQISGKIIRHPLLEDHRGLIEDLARSKDEYTRKFEALTLAIENKPFNQGSSEPHDLSVLDESRVPSDPSTFPRPTDRKSRIIYEMQNYGHLINRLLGEINAVEYCIEPIIGSRIRDDVVFTHRREADRLGSLHGRKRLKATITGIAWDLIKTLSDTGESDPSSTGNDSLLAGPLNAGDPMGPGNVMRTHSPLDDGPTTKLRSNYTKQWCPSTSLQEGEDETQVSNGLPRVGSVEDFEQNAAQSDRVEAPGTQHGIHKHQRARSASVRCPSSNQASKPAKMPRHDLNLYDTDAGTHVETVPPSKPRDRSPTPFEMRSVVRSTSMSEGSSECMDRDEAYMEREVYDFEVKEQDRWLPIADVARIMKTALPENSIVSKDAKECMQECVSEFISFITSEAAEICSLEHKKTIGAEALLKSMVDLSFENYAEALKIYLAGYRQVAPCTIELSSPPPSIVNKNKLSTEPSSRPAREETRNEPTEIQLYSGNSAAQANDDDHPVEDNGDEGKHDTALRMEHETHVQTTSIVDSLLSQWTTLNN